MKVKVSVVKSWIFKTEKDFKFWKFGFDRL